MILSVDSYVFWWINVMDDWNLYGKPLSKWQDLWHRKFILSKMFYKEWQIMLGLHLALVVYSEYWARHIELVTLNTIFFVVQTSLIAVDLIVWSNCTKIVNENIYKVCGFMMWLEHKYTLHNRYIISLHWICQLVHVTIGSSTVQ